MTLTPKLPSPCPRIVPSDFVLNLGLLLSLRFQPLPGLPHSPLGVPGVSHLESRTPAARLRPRLRARRKKFPPSRESFLTGEK